VICEVVNDDGSVARLEDLVALSRRFDIPIISVQQIVDVRLSGIWPLEADAPTVLVG
jgi:3,4-dihydroxy 2-butanone 4-phosphate synthase/GTP cyclohydrolase II